MEDFGDKEYRDFLEFISNGIEASDPGVVSAFSVTDHSLMSVNSAPSNQEIRVNDELPSVSHGLYMVTDASNNQHLLNSNLSHSIQRFQVLSTCSEDGGVNYALQTDMSAIMNNHYESWNIKEPHFHNQGIQEHCNFSKIIGQNSATNVHIFQSPQNATAHCDISYSGGIPVDDILAVPGPSGIFQNTNNKMLFCEFCSKEIAKHGVAYQGRNLYECCVCRYKSEAMYNLQMHTRVYNYARVGHYYCNVCREVYTGKGSHDVERECKVCGKSFLCKGLLEQHSEEHKSYFDSYCRLCGTEINNHIRKDTQKTGYECCACDFTNIVWHIFQCHLLTHSDLQILKCYVCSKRFMHKQALGSHLRSHKEKDFTS